ncbi:MAG: hydrogenase accessory protein [Gammaproteobacteria bacterium]|jgi:hydrogenase-1 operon protein HyaE|nr:hydrogenase accessory protein [Gammaproteobacteria bacterium]MDH5176546.1 hydrogenase accessory protein [Gammaproteobacteria bacterium]MDH5227446.1 hydrogenase accessory protein [Gammaproteobacteria bacterium]
MSGVIDALTAHPSVDVLRKADIDDFLARNPRALLFFIGDRGEGLDVAVVVRELATSYAGRLRVGVVDQRDEAALMTRFGVVVMPAVVYMRDGHPAELVARMRDWPVFAQAADRLLEAEAVPLTGGNA